MSIGRTFPNQRVNAGPDQNFSGLQIILGKVRSFASPRRGPSTGSDHCSCFEASLAERTTAGLGVDQAQSHINLARLGIANGEIPVALKHSETARALLHGLPPSALYANAEALCAQLKLVTAQHAAGVAHAERALFTNRQIANLRGEAISLLLLARCWHGAGDDAAARRDALACLDVNKKIGDEGGIAQTTEFFGRLEA